VNFYQYLLHIRNNAKYTVMYKYYNNSRKRSIMKKILIPALALGLSFSLGALMVPQATPAQHDKTDSSLKPKTTSEQQSSVGYPHAESATDYTAHAKLSWWQRFTHWLSSWFASKGTKLTHVPDGTIPGVLYTSSTIPLIATTSLMRSGTEDKQAVQRPAKVLPDKTAPTVITPTQVPEPSQTPTEVNKPATNPAKTKSAALQPVAHHPGVRAGI
jgi:hypothetical protein